MTILETSKREKAVFCNEFYALTAARPFPPAPFSAFEAGSADLAEAVARWQQGRDLYADGILGPKTVAMLEGRRWQPPKGEYHIIVAGVKVATSFPVVNWTQPGAISFPRVLEVLPGWTGVSQRPDPSIDSIERFVLHWDEAVSSLDCFHVLLWRNLSVQFCLDADGTLYQTMDLVEQMARHARWANATSIGIEICNPVLPKRPFGVANRAVVEAPQPHTGAPSWRHLDFTPAQKEMVSLMVPALCDALHIPRRLPTDELGQVPKGLIADPTAYRGVLGHYHLQTDKVDPGYTLWPLLMSVL